MKYVIPVIIIFVFIIGLVCLLIVGRRKPEVEVHSIQSMSLFYTKGYMMNADVRYSLECKDTCIAKVKKYLVPEEDTVEVKVDEEFVQKVMDIVTKYSVGSWDGFHESDHNVLDGDSFSFSLVTQEGESVSASGYMSWPKNYRNVVNELDDLFQPLAPDPVEEDS